ncbi:M1 family metallopeptidase [Polaribacter sargassicola]|uniref:M1 family metallopeptidase n=1 Tax=Polaribacter sargassicola TaxID=2836891 RepID=UPI001F3CC24C|nr:M1 family metallopeptidase [Polaribacter sp. DS7-9]MCG1036306.1 M1 family metallopeptidase [Polaribacter sp. DS7-9]
MKKNYSWIILAIVLFTNTIAAQDTYKRNTYADVLSYVFNLTLNDNNNEIIGETLVTVNFKEGITTFSLDLIGKTEVYGMEITNVFEGDKEANYQFINNKIVITPTIDNSKIKTYKIQYHGIAEKGLVIDKTKFGQRSFYGDNWPNLARNWLPCVDHPYDKATIEFAITAPEKYDVVATGKKVEESNLGKGLKLTRYKETAPVATKVITIGVTKFASKLLGVVNEIPVTAWVYPENRLDGFSDYAVATNVLEYYIKNIGPYSYSKLANIQAKTQWGGLENAGTITYFENSVSGKNKVESLIAHEIAHQWFGNSATENSWNHVWLSEGFATYFTILYQEEMYGNEKRKEELALDKKQIIAYYKKNPSPIVDNSIKDPKKVLSTNTYQKGGWFLNMLRYKIGNEAFWNGIRAYYKKYRNSNAMTADFQKEMEMVSNQNLESFFNQWLFVKGYPELKWSWKYKRGNLVIEIKQTQDHFTFNFPLEIGIKNGEITKIETIEINSKSNSFKIPVEKKPDSVLLDPDFWLLFEDKN